MRDKPDQISGFKRSPNQDSKTHADDEDEDDPNNCGWTHQLFAQFCDALKASAPDALAKGLASLEAKDRRREESKTTITSAWSALKKSGRLDGEMTDGGGFSFGFAFDEEDDVKLDESATVEAEE